MSNSWCDPDLRQDMPESLRRAEGIQQAFDHARDPLISAQLKDMKKTEAQRREAQGPGSSMVRSDRPFRELRPKNELGPKRAAFDRAWLREQRAAVMARMEAQQRSGEHYLERSVDRSIAPRGRSR